LGVDIEAPDDHVIEYDGVKLLLIEPRLATNLRDITLDVDDTPHGPELVISEEIVKQSVISGTENWVPLPSNYIRCVYFCAISRLSRAPSLMICRLSILLLASR